MTVEAETAIQQLSESERFAIQQRNRRLVQIDAIGVGLANAASPFLPVFLTRLGASNVEVGLLTTMPGVTGLVLAFSVGRFLQSRSNIVPWFSLARLLVIASYALTGLVPFFLADRAGITGVLGIWAWATLPQTMVAVAFSVVMNSVAGPAGRYDLMSRRWSILGITTAITVAAAGQVLDVIRFPLNYQLVFLGLSLGGLVSYYFSSRIQLLPPRLVPQEEAQPKPPAGSLNSTLKLVRGEKTFLSFIFKRFIYMSGMALGAPLFPLYLVRQLNTSDAMIGFIGTAQSAVLLIGYTFWTIQSRRKGSRFVLLASTLAVALYPAVVALTHRQWLIAVYAAIAGIFQAGIDLVFFDELMKTVPPDYSPIFVSIAQALQYLSTILAPLAGTYLSDRIGIGNALMVSAALRLIGFLLFAMPERKRV